ncbi:MAG: S-adenosylmethionine synthetase [Bacilli bacterium]|nr:S-adenosylmethionine synthetase [Bacilli bacterium]
MIEKVNPSHPDKVADRIAGAIVDLAYTKNNNPKIAVEILLGHGNCHIIIETSEEFSFEEIDTIVKRIGGNLKLDLQIVKQDIELAKNQEESIKCGDNGIFKGKPLREVDKKLSKIAREIYSLTNSDGKYVLDGDKLIICQSNISNQELQKRYPNAVINPLGEWTGGSDVDSGATNRKLGSDMAESLTGGGLHGKDLSKSDVSVNIYAFLKAQETNKEVNLSCAIGDEYIDGKPYSEIVDIAKEYIKSIGGFEKLAEWGLY